MSTAAYPLAWPEGQPKTPDRKTAQWSKKGSADAGGYRHTRAITMSDAMQRLRDEFARMKISFTDDVVVSTNLTLNISGTPRADQANPRDPGVAVYWNDKSGQRRCMAIDIYDRTIDNIAAVARTLEYLRGIERHGGAAIQEKAFTGFAALPPPKSCWDILDLPPQVRGDEGAEQKIRMAHKIKAMAAHPDVKGGNTLNMAEINTARDDALRAIGAA